jgi:hypothetical protein
MQIKAHFVIATVVLLVLAFAVGVLGQGVGFSGTIKGTVSDPTGAAVPNATITLTGVDTGFHRTAVTDGDGEFLLTGIPPASYDVRIDAKGFQSEIRKMLVLTTGQILSLDFQLKVSGVLGEVVVNSEQLLVNTDQPQQANTI